MIKNKKAMGGVLIVVITILVLLFFLYAFGFLDKTKVESFKKEEYCLKWDNETEKCLKFGVDVYNKGVNTNG